jgi:hypothetical protein
MVIFRSVGALDRVLLWLGRPLRTDYGNSTADPL